MGAQDGHLDFHTAPELCDKLKKGTGQWVLYSGRDPPNLLPVPGVRGRLLYALGNPSAAGVWSKGDNSLYLGFRECI